MTVGDAIRQGARDLGPSSDTARLDAELLMAHALGVTRSDMLLRHMDDDAPCAFNALTQRRAQHEPLAYIIGEQEFFGRPFKVTRDTLIPRPDSEIVVETALEALGEPPSAKVLDLGTGSGALLLTILAERPQCSGIGIDASPAALRVARDNAQSLGLSDRSSFHLKDWRQASYAGGWGPVFGPVDLVVANPPYVESQALLDRNVREYEPHSALFAGDDGLDDYRVIIPHLAQFGAKVVVLEIGAAQDQPVTQLAQEVGFSVEIRNDLANRPRCAMLW